MKKLFLILANTLFLFLANAQDFNAYLANFKLEELPFKVDRSTLNWCRLNQKQLKPIALGDLQKFVLSQPLDQEQAPIFVNLPEKTAPNADKDIRFYYYKKLNLSPNFLSVIVYFVDEKDKNGLMHWKLVMLNYSLDGKLINHFELAYEEQFMSYRLHVAEISKDLKMKIEEIDFESLQNTKKPNYIADFYYKIDAKSAKFISIQNEYYPYEGVFEYGDKLLSILQNRNIFTVMEGKAGEQSSISVNLIKYDLTEGTFVFIDNANIKWQGKFDASKSRITLTNKDKTTLIFKRKY